MRSGPVVRMAVGTLGGALLAYGTFRLLSLGWGNLVAALAWLGGGVILHDAVIATVTIALCLLGAAILPRWARGPAAGALLVLGTLTLMAVPVLGRFGARPDNPTLLDRPYAVGWLVLAAVVLVSATVAAVVGRREGSGDRG
jgi:hypothetical protein